MPPSVKLFAFGEILVAGSGHISALPLESCKVFGSRKILIDCSECLTVAFSRVSILSIELGSSCTFSILNSVDFDRLLLSDKSCPKLHFSPARHIPLTKNLHRTCFSQGLDCLFPFLSTE